MTVTSTLMPHTGTTSSKTYFICNVQHTNSISATVKYVPSNTTRKLINDAEYNIIHYIIPYCTYILYSVIPFTLYSCGECLSM